MQLSVKHLTILIIWFQDGKGLNRRVDEFTEKDEQYNGNTFKRPPHFEYLYFLQSICIACNLVKQGANDSIGNQVDNHEPG